MNLPNKLTVSRFVLTAAFLWAMFSRSPVNDTLALVFFCLAGITDFLDGKIARAAQADHQLRHPHGSAGGQDHDLLGVHRVGRAAHVPDAAARAFTLAAFALRPRFDAWMVVIIVARELAITGLRLLAASKNVVLAAERYGKHKTISQIVAIIALLVMDASWNGGRG